MTARILRGPDVGVDWTNRLGFACRCRWNADLHGETCPEHGKVGVQVVTTAPLKPRVYIAGPISKGDLCHNVNQATEAFIALAKSGFAPLCPHWSVYSKPARPRQRFAFEVTPGCEDPYKLTDRDDECICIGTAMGNEEMSHADWMGVDLPWVAMSDALLRLPGISVGADQEAACAREHNVPVFHTIADLVAAFGVRS